MRNKSVRPRAGERPRSMGSSVPRPLFHLFALFLALWAVVSVVRYLPRMVREVPRQEPVMPDFDSPQLRGAMLQAERSRRAYFSSLLSRNQAFVGLAQRRHDENREAWNLLMRSLGDVEYEPPRLLYLGIDVVWLDPAWADIRSAEASVKRWETVLYGDVTR